MKSRTEQPFISHLLELRTSALKIIMCVVIVTLLLIPFANQIYSFIASPLITKLPEGGSMIATEVASPFFAPFKLTLFCAIFFSIPYILYQTWSFIAPGLYKNEKKLVLPLMLSSSLLFYLGVLFAHFLVFPILFLLLLIVLDKTPNIVTGLLLESPFSDGTFNAL